METSEPFLNRRTAMSRSRSQPSIQGSAVSRAVYSSIRAARCGASQGPPVSSSRLRTAVFKNDQCAETSATAGTACLPGLTAVPEAFQGSLERALLQQLPQAGEAGVVLPRLPVPDRLLSGAFPCEQAGRRLVQALPGAWDQTGNGGGEVADRSRGQTPPRPGVHRLRLRHPAAVEHDQGQWDAEGRRRHGRGDVGDVRPVRSESVVVPHQPRAGSTTPVAHSTAHPARNPRGVSSQTDRTRPANVTSLPDRPLDQAQPLHRGHTRPDFPTPAGPSGLRGVPPPHWRGVE
ncbi:hypothetical protein AQJ11_42925 [Streptomyces corchorusii]|uniref:Uncharacterized protein n=1 Tax=Streptomyces corchorusii TaxID=1903 RepID=A0A101PPX2_STRCK|nr:hypothetical protein AQJ11_42925 [Streptomyces corchorusii]